MQRHRERYTDRERDDRLGTGTTYELSASTDFCFSLTSSLVLREVFDILPRIVAHQRPTERGGSSAACSDNTDQHAAAIANPPCSCFSLRSRGDAWALLDWKAVAADPDGSLHVLDFCEISTKTEHDMLYIHPETGESFLPRKANPGDLPDRSQRIFEREDVLIKTHGKDKKELKKEREGQPDHL